MKQVKYKEDKEKVNARSKKHRLTKTTKKLEIVGLNPDEVKEFLSLPGLENLSHAERFRELMKSWNKNHKLKPKKALPDNKISNSLHENENKITANNVKKSNNESSNKKLEKPPGKIAKINIWLRVENNSKFVKGKKKARKEIEDFVLSYYQMKKPNKDGCEYELIIPYSTDEELDNTIDHLCRDIWCTADDRNCFIEMDITDTISGRSW